MSGYTYILANRRHGTLYIGVTSNLARRVYEHKNNQVDGFTKRYAVHMLVFAETHDCIEDAIHREKRLKKYTRKRKIELIESINNEWHDLYEQYCTSL